MSRAEFFVLQEPLGHTLTHGMRSNLIDGSNFDKLVSGREIIQCFLLSLKKQVYYG